MKKLSFLALVSLSSCGSIYSTDYIFTPPATSSGKNCIENCEDYQDSCEQTQNRSKENCEYENQRRMDDCNNKILREKNRAPKWTECGRQITCDYPLSKCEQQYRSCYQSCGGNVKEERKCIANCDSKS